MQILIIIGWIILGLVILLQDEISKFNFFIIWLNLILALLRIILMNR